MKEITDLRVATVFDHYSEEYRQPLLTLRELIFDTAARLTVVGDLEERLKWNQPSYATKISKSVVRFASIVLVLKK